MLTRRSLTWLEPIFVNHPKYAGGLRIAKPDLGNGLATNLRKRSARRPCLARAGAR